MEWIGATTTGVVALAGSAATLWAGGRDRRASADRRAESGDDSPAITVRDIRSKLLNAMREDLGYPPLPDGILEDPAAPDSPNGPDTTAAG